MTDEVLIAIGREVCEELALYGKLHELHQLSKPGEEWYRMMQDFVVRANVIARPADGYPSVTDEP